MLTPICPRTIGPRPPYNGINDTAARELVTEPEPRLGSRCAACVEVARLADGMPGVRRVRSDAGSS